MKKVIFKIWNPFTECINKINETLFSNDKALDVVTPIYNLIEYSNNC